MLRAMRICSLVSRTRAPLVRASAQQQQLFQFRTLSDKRAKPTTEAYVGFALRTGSLIASMIVLVAIAVSAGEPNQEGLSEEEKQALMEKRKKKETEREELRAFSRARAKAVADKKKEERKEKYGFEDGQSK